MQQKQTGGQVFVDCLKLHGVDQIFGVPGESYLAALDALYDTPEIRFNICRQEGGAAMMAEAYAKLTGKPGICMVSRGPGATNASAGLHIASQDSTPMILFIGQVGRQQEEREAYQELDYRRMFGQMSKWTAQISSAHRIPEFLSRAFFTATSGRPGPVVLALPEDMLEDEIEDIVLGPAYRTAYIGPYHKSMRQLRGLMGQAKKPLVLVGGGGWTTHACEQLQSFAEKWDLPVAASLRCQDYFDNNHPCYVGEMGVGINPDLAQRVKDADIILVVGARLGDMTTSGYTLLDVPVPVQKLIHVHASSEEIGRVYIPTLGINSSVRLMADALSQLPAPAQQPWKKWRSDARSDYERWNQPQQVGGKVQMAEVMASLRETFPADTIYCTGAGNYANWVYRFHRYGHYGTQLAPTSGTMGYSIPAAVAAKAVHPERTVVAFAGDGCFMMHGQELATACQYGLNIIVIIINNGIYGTIRMHQERAYPHRVIGTRLRNPAFHEMIESYGGKGYLVTDTNEFRAALADAKKQNCLTLLNVMIEEDLIGPMQTLQEIYGKGRAKKS